jgi:hypothetical protein
MADLMKRKTNATTPLFLLATLYAVIATTPAYAYIDPNATGLISQMAAPVLLVAATAATFLRRQIRSAFLWLTGRFKGGK